VLVHQSGRKFDGAWWALDLFWRLGRLDLQTHYPWLGVRAVCGNAASDQQW